MLKNVEHSIRDLYDLADVYLLVPLPPYVSPPLPALVHVVVITAFNEYLRLSFWAVEGLD